MSDGEGKAEGHDVGLWACLYRFLNINVDGVESKEIAGIPTLFGWSGSSVCDENPPASCWAS